MNKKKYDTVWYFITIFSVLISCVIGNTYAMIKDHGTNNITVNTSIENERNRITVILDAGHGGEDPGAIGIDGTLEKEINMLLCHQIRDILNSCNVEVVLTRTQDKLLYTEAQNIKGQRKMNDLKNRYLIASGYDNAVFISIHMNKYSDGKYSGLQVYYSKNNENSKKLAQKIQSSVKGLLQPNNNREIKDGTKSIYLLDRLSCPAVLVECGFLSNASDCNSLNDKEYRKQLAAIISYAIMENIY